MYESPTELADLQGLLDASLRGSTAHLRSIVAPEGASPNTLSADQLARALTGMCTLAISTVTANGEPRISGIDGHFLHGRWIVGTDRGAAKARHLAARPAVSVAHLRGEELGVFTHGRAVPIAPPDADDPQWPEVLDHLTRHYGSNPMTWGDVVYYRIEPHWMVAYCADPDKVLKEA
ncbi:pyridoxamine 5'-phosphate oxidase family protein [Streptomonospora sp. S1-112]|uniref:Pyridoxamine 5'-phosphate oxidase family protein n=1 Tax=Streptomonospora mangrovi TaxID=2883123 RepID=A0A9X3NL86_9ACTN|nr:pyridoxamine 5'-phosphate oxidase family protein [Streptomonospora mangrovi]MDA0565762.1 pyridoxamine 5'-phosphate oxidase family protein [Streptomonospora mangrovi]